ncbi:MAG: fasciclin domain-containing protein [Pseudomonadota bacterium]
MNPEDNTIAAIAAGNDNFDILVQALTTANLVATVSDVTADFTVFAPTDAAFAQLATDLGFTGDTSDENAVFTAIANTLASLDANNDPVPLLTDILLYHVAPTGQDVATLSAAPSIVTAEGTPVIVTETGLIDVDPDFTNPSFIDGLTDIEASNGTIQAIDRVLLPLDVPGVDAPTDTITDIVAASGNGFDENTGDFDILLAAVTAANLGTALADTSADFTVFAPTDAAFIDLAASFGTVTTSEQEAFDAIVATLTALDPNNDPIPLLTNVLSYHVANGAQTRTDLATSPTLSTLLPDAAPTVDGAGLVDEDPDVADAQFIDAASDIQAANGIVQAIDKVLLPADLDTAENTIAAIAAGNDNFNILVTALSTAGLVDTVSDLGADFTVFAPTDAAFTQLAVDLGFEGDTSDEDAVFAAIAGVLTDLAEDDDPIPLLTDILLYHVAPTGQDVATLSAAPSITTVEGTPVIVNETGLIDADPDFANPSFIDGLTDIEASNGTIQAIDRVLLPLNVPGGDAPTDTIAAVVAASGEGFDDNADDFDILLAALNAANLAGALGTAGDDFTVFAPTDGAFIALAQTLGSDATTEEAALNAIVATLTALDPNSDPIPLLTSVLTYHVAQGAQTRVELAASPTLTTLLDGSAPDVDGAGLVDEDPNVADAQFVDAASDIQTSNGIIQGIDRVLLPIDVPEVEASGGDGDDNLTVTPITQQIDGGDGEDAATFSDAFGDAAFGFTDGGFTVTVGERTIDLLNVESFVFNDQTVTLDTGTLSASVARLYEAALGRGFDVAGVSFWTDAVESLGLLSLAEAFVLSDEFTSVFGEDPSAGDLVDGLFENVLGREADEAGRAFWTGLIEDDANFNAREALLAFSESGEFSDQTSNSFDDGVLLLA